MKHQSLRRHLHHNNLAACICHTPEILLYGIRLRRGIASRDHFVPDDHLNGADQSHLISGRFQNRLHHIGGSGLALRTCDTDDLHLIRGITKISSGNERHGVAGILHLNHRHILRCFHFILHHQNLGSLFHYIRNVLVPVCHRTLDAEKQRTLLHLSGVIYHVLYLNVYTSLQTFVRNVF